MALDLTSTEVSVPHPSPDQEDVGTCPVLCLATSDGLFRFFSLGSRDRAAPPCVAPPRPFPTPPAVRALGMALLGSSRQAGGAGSGLWIGVIDGRVARWGLWPSICLPGAWQG